MSLRTLLERLTERADQRYAELVEQDTNALMIQAANEGVQYARMNVAFKTGELSRSIGYRIDGDQIIIEATAPHAPFVEYGTAGPYIIRAKNAKALRFQVGGSTLFRKSVMHPGNKARPFLAPAIDHAMRIYQSRSIGHDTLRRVRSWLW